MYINSTDITEMERIQLDEGCCGVYTYTDWRYTPWYDDNKGSSLLAPPSCCAVDDVIDNSTASASNISPQVPLQYNVVSQCVHMISYLPSCYAVSFLSCKSLPFDSYYIMVSPVSSQSRDLVMTSAERVIPFGTSS